MATRVSNSKPEFVGPFQPAKSRIEVSAVWNRAPRPGPANYTLPGSLGTQAVSQRLSTHGNPFGSQTREGHLLLPNLKCGRGVLYDTTSSVGKQVKSQHKTGEKTHFGSSTREQFSAQYNAFTYKPH